MLNFGFSNQDTGVSGVEPIDLGTMCPMTQMKSRQVPWHMQAGSRSCVVRCRVIGLRALGSQLLRTGTSAGANYRVPCRARSKADFINKLRIVEKEYLESLVRIGLLAENGFVKESLVCSLMNEGNAIPPVVVSAPETERGLCDG